MTYVLETSRLIEGRRVTEIRLSVESLASLVRWVAEVLETNYPGNPAYKIREYRITSGSRVVMTLRVPGK